MQAKIAVLPGDGIGVEVTAEAVETLKAVAEKWGHAFAFQEAPVGWAAFDETGTALPDSTVELCRHSDAILFGAVGDPARDATVLPKQRPEVVALLTLRKGLYANLRPAVLYPSLAENSALRPEIIRNGVDLLIVRELTGGLYYGQPKGRTNENGVEGAVDTMIYTRPEIERIARVGFEAARKRKKKLCSVDKANILACSQLWREVVTEIAKEYPDVELTHQLVDSAAMQLIRDPGSFDTLVMENTFGDILSDEASMIVGSLGMLPSASLGDGSQPGFYEPIHGSAPDIAGKGIANPIAAILTASMLLRYSFNLNTEADAIDAAVLQVLEDGLRTKDIARQDETTVSTREMGDAIRQRMIK
jgi:3-isopropylmalate dehydrogenase